jgi:predicted phage gp36 major capsid-like protein
VKDPSGFDPARAHKTIVQLREELKTFRDAARKEREAKMSQEERLAAERDEHKTARTAAEKQLWALQAAVKQGLDPADAEYLTGNTEQELQAAAERFAQRHGPARQPAGSGLLGRLAAGVPNQQPPFGGNQFDPEKIAERTLRNR